jgi:hypothetical protein
MISDRDKPEVEPVPDVPEYKDIRSLTKGTKEADPDLIISQEDTTPVDIMTDLLFESIGGQEIINISRNDILNGQNIRYNIIANLGLLAQEYNTRNIFRVSGTLSDFFDNFSIALGTRIPENGTGPALFYVGEENSEGCNGFPVLNRYDDTVVGCFDTISKARRAINQDLAPYRDIVYSNPENGNIVVDVTNLTNNERVDIEILSLSDLENDTIY